MAWGCFCLLLGQVFGDTSRQINRQFPRFLFIYGRHFWELGAQIPDNVLFNSFVFLLFLPIVFLLYWFVFRDLKWQNLFLVIASYVFYGWWDWRFLVLIAMTTLFSYVSGRLIAHYEARRNYQKAVSAINIVLNLTILGVFKYYNFFADNLSVLLRNFDIYPDWITLDVLLPVGISFYTFQALSYSIDVYQKKLPVCRDIISFFTYISFFPQLVAGPIERATNLLPQFYKPRRFNYTQSVDGCRQILWGFFKKVVIADGCGMAVNRIWADYQQESGCSLLWGGILFTFQIYGDFSGYSDIAIGTAKLFGIRLMRNFNYPYFSRDIAEFWRRWHISLTTWFRDYIYIPLGGSRCGKLKIMRNTMIIFLVSGFWHGANWTFIVWGAYHAILFFPLMLFGMNRKYIDVVAKGRWLPSCSEFIRMLSTFFIVVLGWIIFRSDSMGQAWGILGRIFSDSLFDTANNYFPGKLTMVWVLLLLVVEWIQRDKEHALQLNGTIKSPLLRWGIYYLLVLVILAFRNEQSTFIYFQF